MPIKDKNLRKCHSDKRLNIDVLHKLKISEYEKKKKLRNGLFSLE